MLLSIDEKDPRPIYQQLMAQIREQVGTGTLQPGDELPSVRDVAQNLGINLHTARSAYLKLRDQGIIDLRLGRKARIARPRTTAPDATAEEETRLAVREYITDAVLKGLSPERIRTLFEEELNRHEE